MIIGLRKHHPAQTAVEAMVTIRPFTLVALHMPFGGAANLSQWSNMSELATDGQQSCQR